MNLCILKMAPARKQTGKSFRLSGPELDLIMWGTNSPTNPMIPETGTQTAVTKEAVINLFIQKLFIDSDTYLVEDN